MKPYPRSLVEAVLRSDTSRGISHQADILSPDPLDARSDRVLPGFILPAAKSTSTTEPTSSPPPLPPSPPPPPPPPAPPPPPPPITLTTTSTTLLTTTTTTTKTLTATNNLTTTQTITTSLPPPSLTATTNLTLPLPATPHPQTPKTHVSASAILAIVSGLTNIALLLVMFFLVRRFYRMYRQKRVLRKQLQTEGVELK